MREITGTAIITATAVVRRIKPGFVEQRWNVDAQFSPQAVEENQAAIDAPYLLMNIIPAGMHVHPDLMNRDHFRDQRQGNLLRALAVVTDSEAMHTAAKLYLMYHQQSFPSKVFEEEGDARVWLEQQRR